MYPFNKSIMPKRKSVVEIMRRIINITTVVFLVVLVITKRFADNTQLFWIPLLLFVANIIVLIELGYLLYRNRELRNKNFRTNISWIVIQFILNVVFAISSVCFLCTESSESLAE